MRPIVQFLIGLFISISGAWANTPSSQILSEKDSTNIYEKLGQKIDLNLSFTDQSGKTKILKDMFKNKSVLILTLNYYRCTTMCSYQYLNLADVLNNLSFDPNFQVASISFDPTDTARNARQIRDIWAIKSGTSVNNWNFYVGKSEEIKSLSKSLNFYFAKDSDGNYSHTAALFFIQPDGTFYRYLYGVVYDQKSFEYALHDTSKGKMGSMINSIQQLFYKFYPERGKYLSFFTSMP